MNSATLLLAGLLVATVLQTGQSSLTDAKNEQEIRFKGAYNIYMCTTDDCVALPEDTKNAMEIMLEETKNMNQLIDFVDMEELEKQLKTHLSVSRLDDLESENECMERLNDGELILKSYYQNEPEKFINVISYYEHFIKLLAEFCAEEPENNDELFLRSLKVYYCSKNECEASPEGTKRAIESMLEEMNKQPYRVENAKLRDFKLQLRSDLSVCELLEDESKIRCDAKVDFLITVIKKYEENKPVARNIVGYYKDCKERLEKFCANKPENNDETEEEFLAKNLEVYYCIENKCQASSEETKQAIVNILEEMNKQPHIVVKANLVDFLHQLESHLSVCEVAYNDGKEDCEFKLRKLANLIDEYKATKTVAINLVGYFQDCTERLNKFCSVKLGNNEDETEKQVDEPNTAGELEKPKKTEKADARPINVPTKERTVGKRLKKFLKKTTSCFTNCIDGVLD